MNRRHYPIAAAAACALLGTTMALAQTSPPAATTDQAPGAGAAVSGPPPPGVGVAATPAPSDEPSAISTDEAVAQAKAAPDWPCVQRKVETLTATQVWDGPPIDNVTGWDQDAEIQRLIPILASRRVSEEEAAADIKKYAESLPETERDAKLTLLFAGLLAEINRDRASVVNGIETFQKRQRLRAEEIEREGVQIAALQDKKTSEEELTKATELYNWNARIFTERQKSMPLACEIPVIIEQRIFNLAREIRTHMKS